jgi:hypothetical protein
MKKQACKDLEDMKDAMFKILDADRFKSFTKALH